MDNKRLPDEMASNKQPHVMCPACFKGGQLSLILLLMKDQL